MKPYFNSFICDRGGSSKTPRFCYCKNRNNPHIPADNRCGERGLQKLKAPLHFTVSRANYSDCVVVDFAFVIVDFGSVVVDFAWKMIGFGFITIDFAFVIVDFACGMIDFAFVVVDFAFVVNDECCIVLDERYAQNCFPARGKIEKVGLYCAQNGSVVCV